MITNAVVFSKAGKVTQLTDLKNLLINNNKIYSWF